ncbi:MAG: repeat-containing protein [Planctomycetota bacterium]|nr:repeat-containing protein [Planctomycetota bacterium]
MPPPSRIFPRMWPRPLTLITIFCVSIAPLASGAESPVSFKGDVAPILVKKCLGCHNDQKSQSGLNMKTFALFKKGGKTAGTDILSPGKPESSHLIESIRPDANPRMPLKQPPLSDAAIATLERWVAEGARFDGPSEAETSIATLVDPLSNLRKIPVKVPTSDPVTSVAFSPNGSTLAAAVGRSILLFELSTGKEIATLPDHPGPLTFVAYTPDGGSLVATGGRPGQFGCVSVWDVASKTRRHEVRGHSDAVLCAALSPDGKMLATGSYDRLVKLWDLAQGKEIRTLKEHTDAVHSVAFSRDGLTVASGSADRTVKIWDVSSGRKRTSLSDSLAEVYAVAFAPDGKNVLAAGVDRSIRVWSLAGDAGSLVRSAFAHDAPVIRLHVSADGQSLVSGGEDRSVKLWDLATLRPVAAFAGQSDWPMALDLNRDRSRLAVGRYDGSLAIVDAKSGKILSVLRDIPGAAPAATPQLVRNATLNPPAPRGAIRGSTSRVSLSGNGIGDATTVVFSEQGLEGKIVPRKKPDPNALDLDVTISREARVGVHRILVQTTLGTPASQPFAVTDLSEAMEVEPNDDAAKAGLFPLPATFVGTLEKPGDADFYRFDAKAGQDVVFETLARPLGSSLNGALAVFASDGRKLAETQNSEGSPDAVLVFHPEADGVYALRVTDEDFGGSGAHFYRIRAGVIPRVESVFPLGIDGGKASEVTFQGVNLGSKTVIVPAAEGGTFPRIVPPPRRTADDAFSGTSRTLVSVSGRVDREDEPNDSYTLARVPMSDGGVSGRIQKPGDVDHYRFAARKGHPIIVEVYGRRLGSPIDPVIEILDATGKPVPRAVLRPVEATNVAFRDHPSSGRSMRLTEWNDFHENDYVLIGRELSRIAEMPRNPDDDAVLWGTGGTRVAQGERIGLLDTTPEHHPLGQPIYKVEIHPPGASFPPGGIAPVTLNTRNDDGGPGIGKDSRLSFDPPADGEYVLRVEDVRGQGGEAFGYHALVRSPHPDFQLSLSQENPNIPRGGTAIVQVSATRFDGFRGPIDVAVTGLPPGITAKSSPIEADAYSATILLMADSSAPAFSPATWTVTGRATTHSPTGRQEIIEHQLDPGGPRSGVLTVTGPPNLKIGFRPEAVAIRPGERVEMTLTVGRHPAFKGRVPIEVRNLPRGVRVLNIGLNGVLVTETQTERAIFLYAEPWAEPAERPFYAIANCEAAGTEHSSLPIPLMVKPATAGEKLSGK